LTIIDKRPDGECSQHCGGNQHEFCGAKWMLSVYKNPNYVSGKLDRPINPELEHTLINIKEFPINGYFTEQVMILIICKC
jgi:hypothetical protein